MKKPINAKYKNSRASESKTLNIKYKILKQFHQMQMKISK